LRGTPRTRSLPAGFKPLIPPRRIARRVTAMGREAQTVLRGAHRPIAIVVLQGAFVFAADLLRRLPPALKLDVAFLRCASYGDETRSSGRVILMQDIEPEMDLRGRTVLLIDDILDTGLTLRFLVEHLRKRGAARVLTCVLLRRKAKPGARRMHADLVGFDIGPAFLVGYGLDYKGAYRNLPLIVGTTPNERTRRRQQLP
jgi:hypoxanthine phosphoribosyltransferase